MTPSDGFSFKFFEGNGSAPRIEDAKIALEKIVPVGSAMVDYDRFFRSHGGQCANVADSVHFPGDAICSYQHGSIFMISSEWQYDVEYDPFTLKSKRTTMSFGLTGP